MSKPWAVYTDLSGCANIGQGGYATEREANSRLIEMLEGELCEVKEKLAKARRRRTHLAKRGAHHG